MDEKHHVSGYDVLIDDLLACILDMRLMDASSANPQPELLDVLEMGLQEMRDDYARPCKQVAAPIRDTKVVDVCPPPAARLRATTMKKRHAPAAFCSSDLHAGPPEFIEDPAPYNVREKNRPLRSTIRRTSSDRRKSLSGIEWEKQIEDVCIIPARQ
ncbi:hypothetical protein T484DRAFT_1880578 [Baffinella frigidus]|nr:hypothetical protein T484DRAFT_1880578 [Cryptophyta sp. CCMP2293]